MEQIYFVRMYFEIRDFIKKNIYKLLKAINNIEINTYIAHSFNWKIVSI